MIFAMIVNPYHPGLLGKIGPYLPCSTFSLKNPPLGIAIAAGLVQSCCSFVSGIAAPFPFHGWKRTRSAQSPLAIEQDRLGRGSERHRWYPAQSLSPARQRVRSRTGSGRLAHRFDCHRPPGLNNATQDGGGPLRQEDHAAVGMHEEFEPVARLQPEMFADGLWYCRLPFAGER